MCVCVLVCDFACKSLFVHHVHRSLFVHVSILRIICVCMGVLFVCLSALLLVNLCLFIEICVCMCLLRLFCFFVHRDLCVHMPFCV